MTSTAPAEHDTLQIAYPDGVVPDPITPADFKAWRERLGLTQEKIAHEMGVTFTTVWRWEHGPRDIQPMVRRAMRDLELELKAKARKGAR